MNCGNAQNLISAFVDGELNPSQTRAIRQHISSCDDCSREYEFTKTLKQAILTQSKIEPSVDFEARLTEAVFATTQKPAPKIIYTRWAVGLAACTVFTLFATYTQLRTQKQMLSEQRLEAIEYELGTDQAYFAGMDPLSGRAGIYSASYDQR